MRIHSQFHISVSDVQCHSIFVEGLGMLGDCYGDSGIEGMDFSAAPLWMCTCRREATI